MNSNASNREVGQWSALPDFVDPADAAGANDEVAAQWGHDPAPEARGRSAAAPGSRAESDGSASARESHPARQRSAKGRGKKTLTWAEKQQRREKRAEKRRAEEAAERAKDPMAFAREIVLTQLTAAPRSRAQLAEKLRAKEVEEDVIEAVLDRMEDVGLVDDAAYAGMLVRSQVASRGLARRALARELSRKGIEPETAQSALEQVDDDAERERAVELARKKMATMGRLDPQAQTRRLAGLLARKGYPPSLVWSVVKDVQGSAEPDEAH